MTTARRTADIQYIRPCRDRDADARAYAARLGHVLGPWTAPDGGLWCYYALAACVRCGTAFYIAYSHGGGYDGWAAYETCESTQKSGTCRGRATIPGPEPKETRKSA